MQQHLLDFFGRCAVVQRAAHMALELMLLAHGRQQGNGDQASGFQVQPRPLPDIAPGIARDVVLHGQRERRGIGERAGDKVRVIKIDVDKAQAAAQQYQIRSIPTMIMFKDGKIVWRQSGVQPLHTLEGLVKPFGA